MTFVTTLMMAFLLKVFQKRLIFILFYCVPIYKTSEGWQSPNYIFEVLKTNFIFKLQLKLRIFAHLYTVFSKSKCAFSFSFYHSMALKSVYCRWSFIYSQALESPLFCQSHIQHILHQSDLILMTIKSDIIETTKIAPRKTESTWLSR